MTFLNPILLLTLLAVFIPIIIHLLNFRKAIKIEFSTLMFLKEVKEKEVHRIRIKELILLLIRILIITFLVFSFSKPFIKSESYGDASKNKTGLILLDNSFSMEVTQNGKKLTDISKETLSKIKANFNPTDNLIILNSEFNKVVNNSQNNNQDLDKISYIPFSIPSLLEKAENLLKDANTNYFEVFIVSDFQVNNLKPDNFIFNENSVYNKANFYFIPVLKRQPTNIGIVSIENTSEVIDAFSESKFNVKIKNYNNNQVSNKKIKIYYNNNLVIEKFLNLNPFEIQTVDFIVKPDRADVFNLYADLENIDNSFDEIIRDNKFYYTNNISEHIKVLILSDDEKYSEYLKIAFKSINTIEEKEVIQYETAKKFIKPLSDYDVLIINGKNNFSNEEINAISEFHKNSGGIMIFPSLISNIDNINSLLNSISSFKLKNINELFDKDNVKLKFSGLNHYIVKGIYKYKNNENLELNLKETPNISKYFKLENSSDIIPIIKLNEDDFFLAESTDAFAPVLLYSVSADLLMSDFPLRNIFPVLMIKSVNYLAYRNYSYNIISGRSGIIFTKFKCNLIKTPDDKIINLNNFDKGFISVSAVNDLEKPGLYLLSDSSGKKNQYFTVNIDTSESNIDYADKSTIETFCKSVGINKVNIVENVDELSEVLYKSRVGIDLTNLFLYLALIFIILEIVFIKLFFKK